jgi:hypothetical protein
MSADGCDADGWGVKNVLELGSDESHKMFWLFQHEWTDYRL